MNTIEYSNLRGTVRDLKEAGVSRKARREYIEFHGATNPVPWIETRITDEDTRRVDAENIRYSVYRCVTKGATAAGIGFGIYQTVITGQLRWIPLGLAAGVATGVASMMIGEGLNYIEETISE